MALLHVCAVIGSGTKKDVTLRTTRLWQYRTRHHWRQMWRSVSLKTARERPSFSIHPAWSSRVESHRYESWESPIRGFVNLQNRVISPKWIGSMLRLTYQSSNIKLEWLINC